MRTIRLRRAIPRSLAGHLSAKRGDLVAEADLALHRRSRLRVKLLVFRSRAALRTFWRRALGGHLDGSTAGACHVPGHQVVSVRPDGSERTRREVDPRYVAVIGLARGWLNVEVISHEAAHAGFAVAERARHSLWPLDGGDSDREELVCYPAGRIAAAINRFLHARKLYAPAQVR